MNYKIRDLINLNIANKISDLTEQIDILSKYRFKEKDLYFKASWIDTYYPENPHNEYQCNTLHKAVVWLSKENHPMSFTGCSYNLASYILVGEKEILIQNYEAEKLARLKRANMDYKKEI